MRPLHVAMIGTRGVPATYGGVEHHVEALGARLVERGVRVTVFAEEAYVGPDAPGEHLGMQVVTFPSVDSKHLEAAVHAGRSTVAALRAGADVLHYHAIGPGLASPIARAAGRAGIVQTIHGMDAERSKWGLAARSVLQGATWLAGNVPDVTVTVSQTLADIFATRYGRVCTVIPNGVRQREPVPPRLLQERLGLRGGDYVLSLGRLVPEKQADRLVEAFRTVDTDLRLVVAGGSSYTDGFVARVHQLAAGDERVVLPGYVHGELLDELLANAAVFAQPSALEGLPLTLLEAIQARRPVVASRIAPHTEVTAVAQGLDPGDPAVRGAQRDGVPGLVLHDPDDTAALAGAISGVLADLPTHTAAAERLADRVVDVYDWDRATDALLEAYGRAATSGRDRRRSAVRRR